MRSPIIFLLTALMVASAARADINDSVDDAKATMQALDGPSATSAGPSSSAKASAQASGDTSQASSQLAHIWTIGNVGALSTNLLAAAPFSDSNAPKPDIGSVSNLSAGVNTRLDASWIFLPPVPSKVDQENATADFNGKCDAFIGKALGSRYYYNATPARLKVDPNNLYAIGLMDGVPTCQDLASGSNLADFVKQANVQIAARNKSKSGGAPEDLLTLQTGWREAAMEALSEFATFEGAHSANLYSLGLSLLGNEHSYSYVTAAAPTKVIKDSAEGYGIGINASAYFGTFSLLGGLSYERPYKGGMGQQVCSPIGASGSSSCNTATVGAPTRTTARIISLEARALVTSSFALAPRVQYDAASANYGITLPLYFVPNAKKVLTGGLEVGWTKQSRYQGAIVIQKAFSFWK